MSKEPTHNFTAGETVWYTISPRGTQYPRTIARVTRTQVILVPMNRDVEPHERFTCNGDHGSLAGSRDSWCYITIRKMMPEHEAIMRARMLRERLDALSGELYEVAQQITDQCGIDESVMREGLDAMGSWDETIARIRTLVVGDEEEES